MINSSYTCHHSHKAEHQDGFGREMFGVFREHVGLAELGASAAFPGEAEVA